MDSKYKKRQRVKIINPRNHHGYPRYSSNPDIKNHAGDIGTIINISTSLVRALSDDTRSRPLYDLRLNKTKETITGIPEDALELYQG